MDLFELANKIASQWSVVVAAPIIFVTAILIGLTCGWTFAWLVLHQRLTHYRERLEHLQDIIADKISAKSYHPIPFQRGRSMAIGLTIVVIGLLIAAIGTGLVVWNSAGKLSQASAGPQITPAPIAPAVANQTMKAVETKEFTTKTPAQLLAPYKTLTPIQANQLIEPYKGLWIDVSGKVMRVLPDTARDTTFGYMEDGDGINVEFRFGTKWIDKASRLSVGDPIKIRGKIGQFQNGQTLFLLECELI